MSVSKTVLDQMEELAFDEEEEDDGGRIYDDFSLGNAVDDEKVYGDIIYGGSNLDNVDHGGVYPVTLEPLHETSEDNTLEYEDEDIEYYDSRRDSLLSMESHEMLSSLSNYGLAVGESEQSSLPSCGKARNRSWQGPPVAAKHEARRRITISGPKIRYPAGPEEDSPMRSSRRRNLYRPSMGGPLVDSSVSSEGNESSRSRPSPRLRQPTVFSNNPLTNRRVTIRREGSENEHDPLSAAVDRLTESNNDWDNAVAAAAVVAASTQSPAKRSLIQFGRGDYVLVMLTLLNITNQSDDKETFTSDPVNSFGYPAGEGATELQRHGPYKYVLCQVQKVHFDEDERYYTVTRIDSGSEQRADPGWMEPIQDPRAIESAVRAAQRTHRQRDIPKADNSDRLLWLATSPLRLFKMKVLPFYQQARLSMKWLTKNIMHGEDGYVLRFRCTAINFLVLCSLIYLFIDVIALAFLPPETDYAISILASIVWVVLFLELIFECMIRPSDYRALIETDKAYAPLTARNINRFHIGFELIALLMFIPSIICIATDTCGDRIWFNGMEAAVSAVKSEDAWRATIGRFSLSLTFLRSFGLVRHWKQMWILHTLEGKNSNENNFIRKLFLVDHDHGKRIKTRFKKKKSKEDDDDTENNSNAGIESNSENQSNENDQQLKNAATIGTALTVINSHRALFILLSVATILPSITTLWRQNPIGPQSLDLLMSYNTAANSTDDCDFLQHAAASWLSTVAIVGDNYVRTRNYDPVEDVYVLWAEIHPIRCDWQKGESVITSCGLYTEEKPGLAVACNIWNVSNGVSPENISDKYLADLVGIRSGETLGLDKTARHLSNFDGTAQETTFYVRAIFNESHTVSLANMSLFLQLFGLLMLSIVGLTVLREDAGRLVLGPLQRMLKIVVRYAENPLSQTAQKSGNSFDDKDHESKIQLGNYETEQLINAIAKIADLLRKCWGVAGAGIISSNLARTKDGRTVVFNPTVPGKSVYALFGFVAINDFSKQLRVLGDDVMRLINDVARVVHDEVYRWALGDSGQCNKNLGSAFLMVFRIGDFSEVHEKQRRAAAVVFKGQQKKAIRSRKQRVKSRRRSTRQVDGGPALLLSSLPGIQSFADRALLGMLKSFASIHRDKHLREWEEDWRLGAGVGAFKVSVIYGMDAGWAVEGAVGSEYKIDATYLSPHVNMASRMMSACKQYGVAMLMSQAVEELLSRTARTKLRHLDTVYVKGSSVAQRIYTYDCRFDGVDFFLYERTPEQADADAAAYTQSIWDTDQDLQGMRQHIGADFMEKFSDGVQHYLDGRWKEAVELLQDADDLMLKTVLEEGYVDHKVDDLGGKLFDRTRSGGTDEDDEINRIRNEFGDGACKCLVQYMTRRKCIPPSDWNGVRALMSK